MGADELILLQDDAFQNTIDSFFTAQVLAAAIRKLEGFDLIICGRQVSTGTMLRYLWDWLRYWACPA